MSNKILNIHDLQGFTLDGFYFSKGSYELYFGGVWQESRHNMKVSTAGYLSSKKYENIDLEDKCSELIWPILGNNLIKVDVDELNSRVIFNFGERGEFTIWDNEPLADNLLLVHNTDTQDWFTVL